VGEALDSQRACADATGSFGNTDPSSRPPSSRCAVVSAAWADEGTGSQCGSRSIRSPTTPGAPDRLGVLPSLAVVTRQTG